jgi:hypothetical protein
MPGMGMPMAPGMMQQQQFLQEQHMQQHMRNEQQEKPQQGYVQPPPHQDQQQQSELQAAAAGSSSIPAAAASSAIAGVHMIYVDELTSMEERRASLSKYRHCPSLAFPSVPCATCSCFLSDLTKARLSKTCSPVPNTFRRN